MTETFEDIVVGTGGRDGQRPGIVRYTRTPGGVVDKGMWTTDLDPGTLLLDPTGRFLFVECEDPDRVEGAVVSYRVEDDGLRPAGRQPITDPCHVALSPSGRFLVVPSHVDSAIVVLPVHADGSLGSATDYVQHTGSGPRWNQESAHPHCAIWDPQGHYLIIADAGNDTLSAYELDEATGKLRLDPKRRYALTPGTSPRHLIFHPTLPVAYINGESSLVAVALAWDQSSGTLEEIQRLDMFTDREIEALGERKYGSGEILLNSRNSTLYISNRGLDDVTAFTVDPATGSLTFKGHYDSGGRDPRHIALDPTGRLLYVANESFRTVTNGHFVTLNVEDDGALTESGTAVELAAPTSIVVIPSK